MSRIDVHYRKAILARYVIVDTAYICETSTRPGYHIATEIHGFVDPRSLATYPTQAEALDELEKRVAAAMRYQREERDGERF